jgi:hypothetical protein
VRRAPEIVCSRARATAACLVAILGLAVVGRFALDAWLSRPEPKTLPAAASAPGSPPPFFLGIVDGLRAEAFDDDERPWMPFFASVAREGVRGVGVTGEPTMTGCCVRTILTGRNPDLPTALHNFDLPESPGNLVAFLVRRGARAIHAGDAACAQVAASAYREGDVHAYRDRGAADQGETDDLSFAWLMRRLASTPDVVTFHVLRPDHAGHAHGASGPEYRAACAVADGMMRDAVTAFRAAHPDATVCLTADHGVTPGGTHGGGERGARRAPFALAGPRIAKGVRVEMPQSALAPTIAAALSLPPPPLAESPPDLSLTTLDPAEQATALDAYLRARLEVARALGHADVAGVVETKRAQVWLAKPAAASLRARLFGLYAELEATAFSATGGLPAAAALALAALVLAALVRLAGRGAGDLAGFTPLLSASGVRVLAICAFVGIPVLAAAGFAIQDAYHAPGADVEAVVSRVGAASAVVGAALLLLALRPRTRERARALVVRNPGLSLAAAGLALGLLLSFRIFVDRFIHTLQLVAILGLLAAVVLVARRAGGRAAIGAKALVLACAFALIFGGRVGETLGGPEWAILRFGRFEPLAATAGAGALLLLLDAFLRRRPAVRDLPALLVATEAIVAALGYASVPSLHVPFLHSATVLGALGAFGLTLVVGGSDARADDARLSARLLAALALARVLQPSDAQAAGFAVLAIGCRAAASLPAPSTRLRVAGLAVLVLVLRTAAFHALGHVESESTVDVAGGFGGRGAGGAEAGTGGWTIEMWIATALQFLRFSLVWIAMLAAAARSFARAGAADGLRRLVADLATTYGGRAAVLVAGLWVWWRSSWGWRSRGRCTRSGRSTRSS